MVSDADVIKQITHDHPAFPKPTQLYAGLARFGQVINSFHNLEVIAHESVEHRNNRS
jgi:hypothetical protein